MENLSNYDVDINHHCLSNTSDQKISFSQIEKDLNFFQERKEQTKIRYQPLAIIDIDGTIFNNFNRQTQIFKEKILPKYPFLKKHKFIQMWKSLNYPAYSIIPYIEKIICNIVLLDRIKREFQKWFLSNIYLPFDVPFLYGKELIYHYSRKKYEIWFLTGRPIKNMYLGTVSQLNLYFPQKEYLWKLIMKYDDHISDDDFKINYLRKMKKVSNFDNRHVVYVDDNSKIINHVSSNFPKFNLMNCNPYLEFKWKIPSKYQIPWI